MIDNLKQRILKQLTNGVDVLFSSIDEAKIKLSNIEKSIVSTGQELLEVNSEVTLLRKEKNLIAKQISVENSSIQKEKNELVSLRKDTKDNVQRANKELTTIENQIKTFKQTKIELEKEIRSTESIKKLSVSLERNLNNLAKEIKEKNKELKSIATQEESFVKSIKDKQRELSSIEEVILAREKETLPKVEELNDREERIKEKEQALVVVENRYRKLYADKGARFKV